MLLKKKNLVIFSVLCKIYECSMAGSSRLQQGMAEEEF